MLSKEEIELAIERLKYINMAYDCCNYYSRYDLDCIETLLQYIEQLETNNKKLIEKLEEILKEYEHVLASEESAINLYSEIKKVVKGIENECN